MGLELLRSLLLLVQQGSESNWWGIVCPAHCRGLGVGGLVASYLLGFLSATVLAAVCLYFRATFSVVRATPEVAFQAPSPQQAPRRRLVQYAHGR